MEETAIQALNRLKRQGRLSQLAISETGFGFDPQSGQSFSLNNTGLFTLNKLVSGIETEQLAVDMADKYEIDSGLAKSAIEVFIRQLGRYLQ